MNESSAPANGLDSEGDLNLSFHRVRWQRDHLSPEATHVVEEDARWFYHQALSTPCLNALQGAEGSELIDWQGRRLLDFHGNSAHQVGYGNLRVLEAMRGQIAALPFCPRRYTNEPAIRLAKRLATLAPGGDNRVLFAPGGTVAMGMALKIARAITGRYKTISLWESFHGASLDMVSLGGEAIFRRDAGPLLPGCEHVPPPDPSNCPFRCGATCNLACADYVEYVLEREGDVAAVVAETVRCTPFIPPLDYWSRIRSACDRHGALLILDEIPIGLGRTGKMFAVEHYDIRPDLLVIGKGLGGGLLPLAAVIGKSEYNECLSNRAVGHYTHEKNPVACAVGLAVLDCLHEDELLENCCRRGEELMEGLHALQRRHSTIHEVRGLGLLCGLELRHEDGTKARELTEHILYECLARGLSFKTTQGNIVTLTPPLTISSEEIQRALETLDSAFDATTFHT